MKRNDGSLDFKENFIVVLPQQLNASEKWQKKQVFQIIIHLLTFLFCFYYKIFQKLAL